MPALSDEFNTYMTNLKEKIDFVLVKDVAPAVVDRIENMAGTNVYAAYEPTQYERRYSLLNDTSYDRSASNMTLEIDCTVGGNPYTEASEGWDPGEIGDLITEGVGYHWHNSEIYQSMPYPRPWMEPGLQDAINDHSAENALETGLVSLGF